MQDNYVNLRRREGVTISPGAYKPGAYIVVFIRV